MRLGPAMSVGLRGDHDGLFKAFIAIAADLVNTVSAASFELGPEATAALIKELGDSRYLQILPPDVTPEIGNYRANTVEKTVMQRIIDRLEYQNEMDWRIGENRTLWLHVRIGDEYYWVAAGTDTVWTPRRWLILIMFVVFGVVMAFGVIATRHIAKPLAALKRETDRLSLGSDWRLAELKGPIEIRALAKSFQRMTERLQEAESIRAETLAELSHDLRTPLTRLRLAVEMMTDNDDLKSSAARQVEQIDRLIDQFMDYARNEQTEWKTEFDLSGLILDIAEAFGIEASVEAGIVLKGQKELIRRAVINLVDNAEKYGAPPVRLQLNRTGSHAVIQVMDMGCGFDPETGAEMLRPFKRAGHQAHIAGSGLGLTIVNRVAASYGGEITFSRMEPAGFVATLSLALQG